MAEGTREEEVLTTGTPHIDGTPTERTYITPGREPTPGEKHTAAQSMVTQQQVSESQDLQGELVFPQRITIPPMLPEQQLGGIAQQALLPDQETTSTRSTTPPIYDDEDEAPLASFHPEMTRPPA